MEVDASGSARNRIKIRSLLIAVFSYLFLIVSVSAEGGGVTFVLLLYLAAMVAVAQLIYRRESQALLSDSNKFRKNFPFRFYGQTFGDFQHVFFSATDITQEVKQVIESELTGKTPAHKFESVSLTDVDKDIKRPETRSFLKSAAGKTERGTDVTLMLETSVYGKVHSVHWWVLVRGYIDRNKYFNYLAYAPLIMPFWLIRYIKKEYDAISPLRSIYPGFYNDLDIMKIVRCLHDTVFEALVDVMEKHGIDTSDLKIQRAQVMNINISGGKATIGNIVQGATNKITAAMRAKAA